MKRLSIIVPVYNVDKYLGKCLDSLIDQDIPINDYEVIIVNDGSNDSSLEIAESFVKQYPNLKLFSQENIGIGSARNLGISESKGEYILLVDSDDFIQHNCLIDLLNCIEKENLDILRYNYEAVNEKGKIIPKTKNSVFSIVYSEKVVDGETFMTEYLGWACYPWLFLYRASFIKENHLLFEEHIYFEDVEWLIRVLPLAKRVRSINKQVYCYLQRYGSITQSVQFEKKNKVLSDKLYVVEKLKQLSQTTRNKKVNSWCYGMISLTFMGILSYVENELPERKKGIIELLHDQEFLPLKSYRFTLKQMRDLLIINISPLLYCSLKKNNKKRKFHKEPS